MTNHCGAWQVGNSETEGKLEFRLFFPSGADPKIETVEVLGTFQTPHWDLAHGLPMTRWDTLEGTFWEAKTADVLAADFYEYKYRVKFQDDPELHWISDPCARYSGLENDNSAVVVGGSRPADNVVPPVAGGRKPYSDLIIYELMIDDFGQRLRQARLRESVPSHWGRVLFI